jgi:glycosyltransferase involved in cell wall biosynthesis
MTEENPRFAIVMATYYRKNDKTKYFLYKSLQTILEQEYTNWDLIVVGDKYEKEEELISILDEFRKKTHNKIIYINNQNVERDKVKDKKRLWRCAGANSMNIGLKYSRENGYKYYAHLDDDDYWKKNHLSLIADIYKKYENCIFINTQSKHINNTCLPKGKMKIYPNNMLPTPEKMIHSSFSFRLDIIKNNYETNLEIGIDLPSDYLMLGYIKNFLLKNPNYCSIYIPELTCFHEEEGSSIIN